MDCGFCGRNLIWVIVANDHLSGFVEGLDAREWESKASPKTQEDDFDFHQGYVTISKPADLPLSLRAGRQELEYGAKRLISAPRGATRFDRLTQLD